MIRIVAFFLNLSLIGSFREGGPRELHSLVIPNFLPSTP